MCVQDADDRCDLQITLRNGAGSALHRRGTRVIHCLQLCFERSGTLCTCFAMGRDFEPADRAGSASRPSARSLLRS